MDEARWRELACVAIGAALIDKDVRARLGAIQTPLWPLSQIADGLRESDGGLIWRGVERAWGIESDGHERVIDRVLEELARIHDVRLLTSLMEDLVTANAQGVPENVDAVLEKLGAHFKGKRNGRADRRNGNSAG